MSLQRQVARAEPWPLRTKFPEDHCAIKTHTRTTREGGRRAVASRGRAEASSSRAQWLRGGARSGFAMDWRANQQAAPFP